MTEAELYAGDCAFGFYPALKKKPARKMRYKFLVGDVDWQKYGGKFISENTGTVKNPMYHVIEVGNLEEECDSETAKAMGKYLVCVFTVCPKDEEDRMPAALECAGYDHPSSPELAAWLQTEFAKVEVLLLYGEDIDCSWSGGHLMDLMRQAKEFIGGPVG